MSEQPLTPEERGDLHVLLARAAATGEALWVASWALALPHRLDDKLCGCDSCMDYAGEDEGFAWDRLPPASRIILRVLDSGDDRFEPIRAAIREHDIDPTPPASAVPETRDLGTAIRGARTAARLTLRSLAEAARCDFTHLSKVENGHDRPARDLVARIDAATSSRGKLLAIFDAQPCPRCGLAATPPGPDREPNPYLDTAESRTAAMQRLNRNGPLLVTPPRAEGEPS
ncbi:MAG: hypothetical protein RL139_1279 [Gemmatimonadota bacterium]|jgi:transcriptional regulator with XRE-family HTH domain